MNARTTLLLLLLPLMGAMGGCVGMQSFGTAARAGDTVALPVGWLNLKRENLTVKITDAGSNVTTYLPGNTAVKSVVKLYPDPSSGLVVGERTQQDLGNSDSTIASNINQYVTSGDREWWQSTLILNLPATLVPGKAVINVTDSAGGQIYPISVEVLPGVGSENKFNVYRGAAQFTMSLSNVWPNFLKSLETTSRYAVTFSNSNLDANGNEIVPHSIQLDATYTAGIGKPWVVNPRGDIKNIIWTENGSNLRIMVTPTKGNTLGLMVQEKIYIAGGITGLSQPIVKAYDINGTLMTGVTATVTPQ